MLGLLLYALPLGEVFFVSPTGDDASAGTIDAPLRTLAHAQALLRSNPNATGVVLRGGIYTLDKPLALDARDAGRRGQPKVWSAFPGERPVLSGGTPLLAQWFSPITDIDVRQQLPLSAREHVLEIDLSAHGVLDMGRFSIRGSINGNAALDVWKLLPSGLEMFFLAGEADNEVEARAAFARWPNAADGWSSLTVTGNVTNSTSFQFGPEVGARVPSWRTQLARGNSSDVWAHGFWQWRWADAHYPLLSVDPDRSEFSLGVPPQGEESPCHGDCGLNKIGAGSGAYYVYNLLAELDEPGEVYINRTSCKAYVWPLLSGNWTAFASRLDRVLDISGVHDLVLRGLHVRHARGAGVTVTDSADVIIEECSVSMVGAMGINISGGARCSVVASEVTDCGSGGVYLDGGDRVSLTPGGHEVRATVLSHVNRWVWANVPQVFLAGVGQQAVGNELMNGPHQGVWFQGNNHLISGNTLHDLLQATLDSGAVYGGRDWTYRGNKIVGNTFFDLQSGAGADVSAVYLDDFISGVLVAQNNFSNVSRAFLLGGGRDNAFVQNRIVGGGQSGAVTFFDARGLNWDAVGCHVGGITYGFLARVPINDSVWLQAYGDHLSNITNDQPCTPKFNVFSHNCYEVKDGVRFISASAGDIAAWGSEADDNVPCVP
jgi:hypothetical protein